MSSAMHDPTGVSQVARIWDLIHYQPPDTDSHRKATEKGLVFEITEDRILLLAISSTGSRPGTPSALLLEKDILNNREKGNFLIHLDATYPIPRDAVTGSWGSLSSQKIDVVLRQMTRRLVRKHYESIHKPKELVFIPGESFIHYAGRVYDSEEMGNLADACLDFWLTAGRFAQLFEDRLSEFIKRKHCILTNSGSSANLLAVSTLCSPKLGDRQLEPGDEVITTACGFPTTVAPIIQNNLIPVFIDVDLETYNVDATKIEDSISDKTKAIFLAHTLGNPFDLDKIVEVSNKHNLWLIEDNCDGLGSTYKGRYTGTFGDIATFSFYPAHHITTGEGGALATDNLQLKQIITSFRDWGRDCWCDSGYDNTCGKRFGWKLGDLPYGYDHKYIYSHLGYNLKITEMQASIGLAQLKKLPEFIKKRQENWRRLYKELSKYEDTLILPRPNPDSDPSWFGFLITVRESAPFDRSEIVAFLDDSKIATRALFAGNIIRQPCFQGIQYRVHDGLDSTDAIMQNTFWIGVYPGLSEKMITYIADKFDEFLKQK